MINFKFNNSLKTFGIFAVMLALVFNSSRVIEAAKEALILCFSSIIPSLFPFMVLSSLLVGSVSDKSFKSIAKIINKLFGISSYSVAAFICGIVCGYPIGAKCTAELYRDGKISASEAESLLAYSNNSGPLFVIGAAGCGILGSFKAGVLLYTVHVLCAVSAAFLLKPYTYSKVSAIHTLHRKKSFTDAVCESTVNVLNVCGFIVFFAVINALLLPCLRFVPIWCRCIITGIVEITNCINYTASQIHPLDQRLAITAAALGWSGISVHMQVKSVIKDTKLSMKKYYITRAYIAFASAALVYFAAGHIDDAVYLLPIEGTKKFFAFLSMALGVYACILTFAHKKRGKRIPSFSKD